MLAATIDGSAIIVALIAAIPATIAAVAVWRQSKATRRELQPNGGSSAFDKIGHRFDSLERRFDSQDQRISAIEDVLTAPAKTTPFPQRKRA